jgi:uncharacterized protein DUF4331
MSSHREAPAISKDPVADSTDLYAFVSPDDPGSVTIIANYVPLEGPSGGPNFYEFGDDVLYEVHIDNDGDNEADITYQFRFTTKQFVKDTFLYNNGQILTLNDAHWNRRQFYSVTRVKNGDSDVLASGLSCPPCNVGPRSIPNYSALADAAIHSLPGGGWVFAGQRREGFFVDLGSVFDLLDLRPIQSLHLLGTPDSPGVDSGMEVNVHSIAIKVPKSALTRDGSTPTDQADPRSVVGVWTTANRRRVRVREEQDDTETGPWMQVSRLGNPLFNEVIVPMGDKDRWNALPPKADDQFAKYVKHPEVATLLPVLYQTGGVTHFPNLKTLNMSGAERTDLVLILLTGIPSGPITGFQNHTSDKPADLLRLNMAISPGSLNNPLGVIGGDLAGFPNGRRVFDDVVAIELRCIAGAVYKLIDNTFTPDAAIPAISDFTGGTSVDGAVPGSDRYLSKFPYLGLPLDGFNVESEAS